MDIAIGTAQFGQDYGICNTHGAIRETDASNIIDIALANSINVFDTARMYGESETVLGNAITNLPAESGINIITKYYADPDDSDALLNEFEESREKLGINRIHGILIHNAASLLEKNGHKIWETLQKIQRTHNIPKIGVSVYTPEDFINITKLYDINIAQLPCNLLDQRFLNPDIQNIKENKHIEFHARSLFLQGLLLHPSEKLPGFLKKKKDVFEKTEIILKKYNVSHMEICLMFADWAHKNKLIDRWVIGFDSDTHLKETLKTKNEIQTKNILNEELIESLKTDDLNIIDPRLWSKND